MNIAHATHPNPCHEHLYYQPSFKVLPLAKLVKSFMERATDVGATNLMRPTDSIYHLEMDLRNVGDPFVKNYNGNIRLIHLDRVSK